jgi:hypothetical protein
MRRRHPHRHVSRLYERIARRKGHPKAIGAVARHLAEATYWLLSYPPETDGGAVGAPLDDAALSDMAKDRAVMRATTSARMVLARLLLSAHPEWRLTYSPSLL